MRWLALVLVLTALACSACGQGATGDDGTVRLWTGMAETEFPVLQKVVRDIEARTGLEVQLLKVPFEQLRNKFLIAAPADLGPDLLIGPQDWVGVLATAGLLEPLPESHRPGSDFVPVAVEAMTFEGQVYASPVFMECPALFRNPDLLPEAPATMRELIDASLALDGRGDGTRGFYFDLENLYFNWAFFSAEGAYIFGQVDGRTDPFDVGLDTPGAVKAAEFLRALRLEFKLIRPGATTDIAKSLYLDGKAATIINGPWFLGDVRGSKVPYVIEPLPPMPDGSVPKPFVTVHGVMLNKAARQREKALQLLTELMKDESLVALSEASGRPPARRSAFAAAGKNPDIAAFAKLAEAGTPMPNHPAMQAVWEPMRQTMEIVTNDARVDAQAALRETKQRIVAKIRQMME